MIKKKHIIRGLLVAIALTSAAFFLHSSIGPSQTVDSACKQSLNSKTQETSGKMIWESLSQQFVSSI